MPSFEGGGMLADIRSTAVVRDFREMALARGVARYPLSAYCSLLFTAVLLSALLVPLGSHVHVDSELAGFEDNGHYANRREAARRGVKTRSQLRDIADEARFSDRRSDARAAQVLGGGAEWDALPHAYPQWYVTLMYVRNDGGNVLEEGTIAAIHSFEKALWNSQGYQAHGWRDAHSMYHASRNNAGGSDAVQRARLTAMPPAPISSVLQYIYPQVLSPAAAMAEARARRCCSAEKACPWGWQAADGSDAAPPPPQGCPTCCPTCESGARRICGVLPLPDYSGGNASAGAGGVVFDGLGDAVWGGVDAALRHVVRGENAELASWFFGKGFDPFALTSDKLRSELLIGSPLPGFPRRDSPGQEAAAEEILAGLQRDVLDTFDVPGVRLIYGGDIITSAAIDDVLRQDSYIAISSIFIVWIYMSCHLRSAFVATLGMLQLLLTFPVSLFLYAVVFREGYLGPLNVLSFYIMIGIGVDDIFVFANAFLHCEKPCTATFRRAVANQDAFSTALLTTITLEQRLSYALRKAGLPMLVTSTTSAVAFMANMVSTLPAVRSFGLLMGILIATNYVFVMTFFPASLALWAVYVVPMFEPTGVFGRCCGKGGESVTNVSPPASPRGGGDDGFDAVLGPPREVSVGSPGVRSGTTTGGHAASSSELQIEMSETVSLGDVRVDGDGDEDDEEAAGEKGKVKGLGDNQAAPPPAQDTSASPGDTASRTSRASVPITLPHPSAPPLTNPISLLSSAAGTRLPLQLYELFDWGGAGCAAYAVPNVQADVTHHYPDEAIIQCTREHAGFYMTDRGWVQAVGGAGQIVQYLQEETAATTKNLYLLSDWGAAGCEVREAADAAAPVVKTLADGVVVCCVKEECGHLLTAHGWICAAGGGGKVAKYAEVVDWNAGASEAVLYRVGAAPAQVYAAPDTAAVSTSVLTPGELVYGVAPTGAAPAAYLRLPQGWVLSELLTPAPERSPSPPAAAAAPTSVVDRAFVVAGWGDFGCPVYAAASVDAEVEDVLFDGHKVVGLDRVGRFLQISNGWVEMEGGLGVVDFDDVTRARDVSPHAWSPAAGGRPARVAQFEMEEEEPADDAMFMLFDGQQVPWLRRVFEAKWFPAIHKARFALLVVVVAVTVIACLCTAQLHHRDGPPAFFDESHDLYIYRHKSDLFSRDGPCIGLYKACTPLYHETHVSPSIFGCDGVPYSGAELDFCGVCKGSGSTCPGCDGVLGSNLKFSSCGVCGGSELQCQHGGGAPPPGKTDPPGVPPVEVAVSLRLTCPDGGGAPSERAKLELEASLLFDLRALLGDVVDPSDKIVVAGIDGLCGEPAAPRRAGAALATETALRVVFRIEGAAAASPEAIAGAIEDGAGGEAAFSSSASFLETQNYGTYEGFEVERVAPVTPVPPTPSPPTPLPPPPTPSPEESTDAPMRPPTPTPAPATSTSSPTAAPQSRTPAPPRQPPEPATAAPPSLTPHPTTAAPGPPLTPGPTTPAPGVLPHTPSTATASPTSSSEATTTWATAVTVPGTDAGETTTAAVATTSRGVATGSAATNGTTHATGTSTGTPGVLTSRTSTTESIVSVHTTTGTVAATALTGTSTSRAMPTTSSSSSVTSSATGTTTPATTHYTATSSTTSDTSGTAGTPTTWAPDSEVSGDASGTTTPTTTSATAPVSTAPASSSGGAGSTPLASGVAGSRTGSSTSLVDDANVTSSLDSSITMESSGSEAVHTTSRSGTDTSATASVSTGLTSASTATAVESSASQSSTLLTGSAATSAAETDSSASKTTALGPATPVASATTAPSAFVTVATGTSGSASTGTAAATTSLGTAMTGGTTPTDGAVTSANPSTTNTAADISASEPPTRASTTSVPASPSTSNTAADVSASEPPTASTTSAAASTTSPTASTAGTTRASTTDQEATSTRPSGTPSSASATAAASTAPTAVPETPSTHVSATDAATDATEGGPTAAVTSPSAPTETSEAAPTSTPRPPAVPTLAPRTPAPGTAEPPATATPNPRTAAPSRTPLPGTPAPATAAPPVVTSAPGTAPPGRGVVVRLSPACESYFALASDAQAALREQVRAVLSASLEVPRQALVVDSVRCGSILVRVVVTAPAALEGLNVTERVLEAPWGESGLGVLLNVTVPVAVLGVEVEAPPGTPSPATPAPLAAPRCADNASYTFGKFTEMCDGVKGCPSPWMYRCEARQVCDAATGTCRCKGHLTGPDCATCSRDCVDAGGECLDLSGECRMCNGTATSGAVDVWVDSCGTCGPPWPLGPTVRSPVPNAVCTGCDGRLHSNASVDTCGVCGGDDRCKVVSAVDTTTVAVSILWGLDAERSYKDPAGEVNHVAYDPNFTPYARECQAFFLETCGAVEAAAGGRIQEDPFRCIFGEWDAWLRSTGCYRDDPACNAGLPLPPASVDGALRAWFALGGGDVLPRYSQQVFFNGQAFYDPIKAYEIKFYTNTPVSASPYTIVSDFKFYEDNVMAQIRAKVPPACGSPFQTSSSYDAAFVQVAAVNGLLYAIAISAMTCFAVVLAFTCNIVLTVMILVTMGAIILCTFMIFYGLGWEVGAVEAVALSAVIGLSVDYSLHFAEAYADVAAFARRHKILFSRYQITRKVLTDMGLPLVNAALTTVLSTLPLLLCTIKPLRQFGLVMVISISLSILYSVLLFVPLLLLCGPRSYKKTWKVRLAAVLAPGLLLAVAVAIIKATGTTVLGPDGERLL